MSFDARLVKATAFEDAVIEKLRECGYLADRFGQGQLPERQRALLRFHDTQVRWMPDIACSRRFAKSSLFMFLDAKAGDTYLRTGNHDIEKASLDALVEWKRFSKLPTFIITSDWKVHDPERILNLCWSGYFRGTGSGTPFVLWPVDVGQAWSSFFDPELLELLAI